MATLILTAVGTAVGGPIGGAVGAFLGQQVDQNILFKPKTREGPRIQDLAVQTSQYGRQIPRIYGHMRVAGSVIWATDLQETSERQGGGKGQPSARTYSYSVSFAVALSSRAVGRIGRIWADGNLLRGTGGDFKTAAGFRFYDGEADQNVDPLLGAAVEAGMMPAYRGTALAVFEDFDLTEYGGRIPSLTFEVIADEAPVRLSDIVRDHAELSPDSNLPQTLSGFAASGGNVRALLASVDQAIPLICSAVQSGLRIDQAGSARDDIPVIERADLAADYSGESAAASGTEHQRRDPAQGTAQLSLRYYDVARDYQAGLRHARHGQAGAAVQEIDFPAALSANTAQDIADTLFMLRSSGRDRLTVMTGHIDAAITPGAIIRIAGEAGLWRVTAWRWRGMQVQLECSAHRDISLAKPSLNEQPGIIVAPPDWIAGPSVIKILDLPPAPGQVRTTGQRSFAVAGQTGHWRGARLFAVGGDGDMTDTGLFTRTAATMGTVENALGDASALLADRQNSIDVTLLHNDMHLSGATGAQMAAGVNLVLVGEEVLQFAHAEQLSPVRYRLSGLWRGRGGTEYAIGRHSAGERFVLLDSAIMTLPESQTAYAHSGFAAIGPGDDTAVQTEARHTDRAVQPFSPVHLHARWTAGGGLQLGWVRRSRSDYRWRDYADVPLGEESEAYLVELSGDGSPEDGNLLLATETLAPGYTVDEALIDSARNAGVQSLAISVRQKGQFGQSRAARLAIPLS